jgi:anti-sigma factor RsiW
MTKDVHPEDLLARAASGMLSEKERRTLELHLASCPGCRTHRLLEKNAALPLSSGDEGLLIRAENAALARYYRSRALTDRARGPGEERVTRSDGSVRRLDLRTQGGKPPH